MNDMYVGKSPIERGDHDVEHDEESMTTSTQQLITLAKDRAAADTEHSYTKVPGFEPHTWVWLAMRDAYNAGVADTSSSTLAAPPVEHDRALETSRRRSAVEYLIGKGYQWDGRAWMRQPGAVSEADIAKQSVEAVDMRTAFEQWAGAKGYALHIRDMKGSTRLGEYGYADTQRLWETWQSALAYPRRTGEPVEVTARELIDEVRRQAQKVKNEDSKWALRQMGAVDVLLPHLEAMVADRFEASIVEPAPTVEQAGEVVVWSPQDVLAAYRAEGWTLVPVTMTDDMVLATAKFFEAKDEEGLQIAWMHTMIARPPDPHMPWDAKPTGMFATGDVAHPRPAADARSRNLLPDLRAFIMLLDKLADDWCAEEGETFRPAYELRSQVASFITLQPDSRRPQAGVTAAPTVEQAGEVVDVRAWDEEHAERIRASFEAWAKSKNFYMGRALPSISADGYSDRATDWAFRAWCFVTLSHPRPTGEVACQSCVGSGASDLHPCIVCKDCGGCGWIADTAPTGDNWTCFHCGETFTGRADAALRFGTHESQDPACTIDIATFRQMEAKEARYADEDADIHRQMHRMESDHQQALRRAEEAGYAKALKDTGNTAPTVEQAGEVMGMKAEDAHNLRYLCRVLENLSLKRAPDPKDLDAEFFVTANIGHAVKSAKHWLPIVRDIYRRLWDALCRQAVQDAESCATPRPMGGVPEASLADGDMFWTDDSEEYSLPSIDEVVEGWYSDTIEDGTVLKVYRAKTLGPVWVKCKADDNTGNYSYELLAAAPEVPRG